MTVVAEGVFSGKVQCGMQRRDAYERADISLQNLVLAMYEAQVENRPEALEKIIELRAQVKAAYPKPE